MSHMWKVTVQRGESSRCVQWRIVDVSSYVSLGHGEWSKWCKESLGMTRHNANRFLRVFERFSNGTPVYQLPNAISILDALVPFTDEELEQTYELPSGETKKPVDMSRREIEVLKKQLKAEQQERERLERENVELAAQTKEAEQVYPDDYEKIKRENAEYRAKYGDSEGVRNIDDKKREKVYEEFAQELERMRLKYASIALDGANVDLYASANPEYASKINSFNDFWKMYVKTVSNDQIIIEVESV